VIFKQKETIERTYALMRVPESTCTGAIQRDGAEHATPADIRQAIDQMGEEERREVGVSLDRDDAKDRIAELERERDEAQANVEIERLSNGGLEKERDEARADLDELRSIIREDHSTIAGDEYPTALQRIIRERDEARAECERLRKQADAWQTRGWEIGKEADAMRPVVEAADNWRDGTSAAAAMQLIKSVDTYRAQCDRSDSSQNENDSAPPQPPDGAPERVWCFEAHNGGRSWFQRSVQDLFLQVADAESQRDEALNERDAARQGHRLVAGQRDAARAVLDSARSLIVGSPRDWSKNSEDAWLYGLMVGWGDCLESIAKDFHWADHVVDRLRALAAALEE